MAESSRWYTRDGTLAPDEVIGKTTGKPRRVTLKDANELGWVPSVSTIKDIIRKPGLDSYFMEQTLQAAMREPERYRSLIVRVGGFNGRFVEMSRPIQEQILERTVHDPERSS